MTEDFYCEEVLSGRTPVEKVMETEHVSKHLHFHIVYGQPLNKQSLTMI